jgi:hypothetical protein
MRKFLLGAATLAACAAAPASAQPINLLTAATGQAQKPAAVSMTKATLVQVAQGASKPKRQPVLIEFTDVDRPAGFTPGSAGKIASKYCRTLSYSQGRALQLSEVRGAAESFAYTAVDRILCFD